MLEYAIHEIRLENGEFFCVRGGSLGLLALEILECSLAELRKRKLCHVSILRRTKLFGFRFQFLFDCRVGVISRINTRISKSLDEFSVVTNLRQMSK